MNDLFEMYFNWPVLPFSVLLCLVTGYWLMVILGGIDMDVIDIDLDLDFDADVDATVADLGMLSLKWLNIGEVPFMLWLSIVALASWTTTMFFDRQLVEPSAQVIAIAIARSLGLGILSAKLLTNPLRGKFKMKQPNTVQEMIGRTCSIVTNEVNTTYGNAVCHVEDGAPLRLNVRTLEGSIPRDASVRIVDYAPETGIYYVEQAAK